MKTLKTITQLQKATLTVLLSMSFFMLHAQNILVKQWDYRFGGTYRDVGVYIQQTKDGGYIIGGYSKSDSSGDKTQGNWDITLNTYDYWIVKIDSLGSKQWDKNFGGTGAEDLRMIEQTSDGGYILGGSSSSGINGDKSQATWGLSTDYWIVKIDSLGNKQWDKDFGGTGTDYLFSLQQTYDGGYILGGYSNSIISGDKTQGLWGNAFDFWIVKTDSLGNKLWDKDFGTTNSDGLRVIRQTTDGGYIIGGSTDGNISGDKTQVSNGGSDYWIIKTDGLGNKLWDKDYGGLYNESLCSMEQTSDGGYIIGGISMSGISGDKTQETWGGKDYWIVKTDSLGNKQWDKDFGGTSAEDDIGKIAQTTDRGYLVSGTSFSPLSGNKTENNLANPQTWVLKTDSLGFIQWDKTLQSTGTNNFSSRGGIAIQANDGCFVMANFTDGGIAGDKTQDTWGDTDYWIIKFCDTSQAIYVPSTSLMSSDTNFCNVKCIDFTDLSTNNPTSWQWLFPGSDSLMSNMQNPINICYNSYGSFDVTLISCNSAGCDTLFLPGFINEYQQPTPTITQSNDTLFSSPAVDYQWWSVDSGLIVGATNAYYIPTQGGSYFVVVTDTVGCNGSSNPIVISSVNELAVGSSQLAIAPNPNNGSFTISLNHPVKDYSLHIINSLGQTLKSWQSSVDNGQFKFDVDLGDAPAGLYIVELITNEKVYRHQFVKE
jgi:hypothetical protein